MHAVELEAVAPLSPEWHEQRRAGIGASEAAAVCGLDRWKGPFAVWAAKVHGDEQPDNDAMEWGRRLEAVVAEKFADDTGLDLIETPCLEHPSHGWMRANCDRLVAEPGADSVAGVLEIKTTAPWNGRDWDDEPPEAYQLQVQHQLAVTDLPKGWLSVLIGGRDFRTFEIERDEEVISNLIEIERTFWERFVLPQVPPPVDGLRSTTDALARLYEHVRPESEVELPCETATLLGEIRRTKAVKSALQADLDELENALKAAMADNEIGLIDGQVVCTWKQSQRKAYTVKASTVRRLVVKAASE